MKRILVNATHAEEIRVALCKGNHLYDFDLENRTREQKKANIYKGHVTRVEPSLEAVFVEYGSERQGFLSVREIAREYLKGDPRSTKNIRELISEGDELLVQVEKEERGNKGAALSTYISLAGRYLVLMPNNASGGGISRQISGQTRDDMKRMLSKLTIAKGMSVIIRTAGIGRTQEDLQNDLDHLLSIWQKINHVAQNTASPCLTHREAGVVTRAVRDYLRDDIAEVWIDNEQAYNEAHSFVSAVMPHQVQKLRKYLDIEPMFARFGVENQIKTAYLREVKLPSGGSIVIDQTEALVSIDINSAKATKGADVESTAHNTNLEAADEIARQLRLRDMGGLVVIDFIDMMEDKHQRSVEQRLRDATQPDRARLQFTQISRFGLLEMSRQRLRPSLEEATGYKCPRCHGTGMIRDLGSLALSIMRNIEEIALREGRGEVQAEVPIEVGAFLLNEKRDSLVYLEQDSGARITILPHAHLETPHYKVHFNRDGYAPTSYDRINDTHIQETQGLGYNTNWQTDLPTPEKQAKQKQQGKQQRKGKNKPHAKKANNAQATAWLSNLFQPAQQATTSDHVNAQDAATAIEEYINDGNVSLGADGQLTPQTHRNRTNDRRKHASSADDKNTDKNKRRKPRDEKRKRKDKETDSRSQQNAARSSELPKRESNSRRPSRGRRNRDVDIHAPNHSESQSTATETQQTLDPNDVHVNINKSEKANLSASQIINIDLDNDTVTKTPVNKKPTRPTRNGKHDQSNHPKQNNLASTTNVEPSVNHQTEKAVNTRNNAQHDVNNTRQADQPLSVASTSANATRWEGRAKNDPRQLASPVAISGSIKAFTQNVLGHQADELIDSQGIVSAFITALNQAQSTATATPPALSTEVLAAYRESITSVAHATADAGTIKADLPTPAYRASNDPRGRISGFEEVPADFLTTNASSDSTIADSAVLEEAVPSPNTPTELSPTLENQGDLLVNTAPDATTSDAAPHTTESVATESETTPQPHSPPSSSKRNLTGLTVGDVVRQHTGSDTLPTDDALIQVFLTALNAEQQPQPNISLNAQPAAKADKIDVDTETSSKKPAKKAVKKASTSRSKAKRTSRKAASAEISRPEKTPDAQDTTEAPKPKRRGRPPKKKPTDDESNAE